MRWTAPPDKREITLVILCLTVYFLAYNIDASLQTLGIDPAATQGAVFSRLGLGRSKDIGKDGRKPPGWRDSLEGAIFGDWTWDEGHVAGDGKERYQPKGTGRHGATWMERPKSVKVDDQAFGDSTVDNALQRWGDDLPQTRLVKHVPGYNILDNVYIFNGSVYLVTDSASALPHMSSIVESAGNGFGKWEIISSEDASDILGTYGSTIRGVSWMSADSSPHNSTLFALWRAYSSLDRTIDETGLTKLPPPQRLIFPHNRFFVDQNPPFDEYWIRRARVDTGFHPYLSKAALPQLTVQYLEDWEDYQKMEVPFVYERLVIADRTVASKAAPEDLPVYSTAFDLDASEHWWEPVRRNLAQYVGEYEVKPKAKKVVTYLHTQSQRGPKLSSDDHENLVKALEKMTNYQGYELHVVSTQTSETDWVDRMTAIVKSSVILSVHGDHLMDSVFMRPTPQPTVMELFPADKFVRDREFAVHSVGLHYVAWLGNRYMVISDVRLCSQFGFDLPPVSPPHNEAIEIDIEAIVRSIHESLAHS
ncbi:hypothetical protein GALMADRAFT_61700 [Galerina marginata CBS 339.88]|uniref:Uncharacterized protein n=1 Tax=Galerina marginata (strain CBS 339.88) TaxID=685588 RepID=A0A067TB00_GALM3|nr:hypothetical protein GALMADRAFT_61700 [Galerina marginata CBS 339.88]